MKTYLKLKLNIQFTILKVNVKMENEIKINLVEKTKPTKRKTYSKQNPSEKALFKSICETIFIEIAGPLYQRLGTKRNI